jgi:hypothetical protein
MGQVLVEGRLGADVGIPHFPHPPPRHLLIFGWCFPSTESSERLELLHGFTFQFENWNFLMMEPFSREKLPVEWKQGVLE